MTQIEMDKNLMVVAAIEGYSGKYNMETSEVFKLFKDNKVLELIRSQYEALHTQSLDESLSFAEDILSRRRESYGE